MDPLFYRKILIIDPDAEGLCDFLSRCGSICRAVKTFKEGRAALSEESFDLVICELSLADGNAAELSGAVMPPVVIYSAENSDDSVVDALSRGAVDYIFKPCSPRVLAARIGHKLPPRTQTIRSHGLALDMGMRVATYCGQPVKLTSSEFHILCFLMTHPGKFFSADTIYEKVWNASSMQTSVVRFHISNLKKTLLSVTGQNLILTEFGAGYAFVPDN